MDRVLKIEDIDLLQGKFHILKKPRQIFPFNTHGARTVQNNFRPVVSELARLITNLKIDQKQLDDLQYEHLKGVQKISEYIGRNTDLDFMNDEVAKVNFIRFLEEFLFKSGSGDINIVHPYLYNIGDCNTKDAVVKNLSSFSKEILIGDDPELQKIFTKIEADDVLMDLIVSSLQKLLVENKKGQKARNYQDLFPHLTKLYREDLHFMMQHNEFFLENFEVLTNYYTFMYAVQGTIQFPKFTNGNYDEATPLYFVLDWESITKKRSAASPVLGYKMVKQYASQLFAHEHVLGQLSYNILNKDNDYSEVKNYRDLVEEIDSLGSKYTEQFRNDLKDWIKAYSAWAEIETPNLGDSVEDLLKMLLEQVIEGMNDKAQEKYGSSIEHIGLGTFLKQRGSLGYLFNITHDFLMMMTAVIVKDERMPLKTLLGEFEKRGMAFDRFSIIEIVTLFNTHNLLDNKSDSGDAQYVKPIL
ncbi:DNA phosphorothioation-dependent restriction protein DptG [Lysinibacillus fusiformis]|uniref:DNA phosphorothioation-dependent restriction protein DptG n=1 Tax=Lysinibacillus fusiformis TaxID=28031 RepID=UPI0035C253F5